MQQELDGSGINLKYLISPQFVEHFYAVMISLHVGLERRRKLKSIEDLQEGLAEDYKCSTLAQ